MTETQTNARDLEIWTRVVEDDIHGLSEKSVTDVEQFALSLGSMTDAELFVECQVRIYNAALMQRFRRPVSDHAMCTLCFAESRRRNPDPGGDSIYTQAHKAVMRSQGYGD